MGKKVGIAGIDEVMEREKEMEDLKLDGFAPSRFAVPGQDTLTLPVSWLFHLKLGQC